MQPKLVLFPLGDKRISINRFVSWQNGGSSVQIQSLGMELDAHKDVVCTPINTTQNSIITIPSERSIFADYGSCVVAHERERKKKEEFKFEVV